MTRIASYTLRIMGPDTASDTENQEVVNDIGELINATEDDISTELPEGYYCKIDG